MKFTEVTMRNALLHAKERTVADEGHCDFSGGDFVRSNEFCGYHTFVSFTDGSVLVVQSEYDTGYSSDPGTTREPPTFHLGMPESRTA